MKKNKAILFHMVKFIFTPIFFLWFHPTIVNREVIPKEGAAVIAGNHKHALDPILVDVCTNRIVHTLAKKDLHDGAFGWFFRGIGSIPVDLHANRNHDALMAAIDCLEQGELINVSPEAKRNYTNQILLPFKPGAVVMSKRCGCSIIPYAITGEYKFRSKNLKIQFGEPFNVADLPVEEANELLFLSVKSLLCEEVERNTKDENKA